METPTEIPLVIYNGLYEMVKETLTDLIDDKLEGLLPKAISKLKIAGTLWDLGEGANEAINEASDLGLRAVKYFRMPREFYFETRTSTIEAYLGSDVNVTIPDEIDGQKVLFIAADIFKDKKTAIESITFLSEGIKTIPANAFADCTSLKTVTLGKSSIGDKVFVNCPQLTTVYIPSNIKKITFGKDVFQGTNLDFTSRVALRKLGYKGAGVGEGFFIQNRTGAAIAVIEIRVGSGWSPTLTRNVRNGQTVEVELAPGTYDIRLRASTMFPSGDIYAKTNVIVDDGAAGTTVTRGATITTVYTGTTEIFTAYNLYTLTRADYQAFIQVCRRE